MGKVGGAWKATCLHRKRKCGAPSPRDHQSCARMEVRWSLLLLLALKTLWAGEHEGETGLEPGLQRAVDGRAFVCREISRCFRSLGNSI